jgi:iron complex outermembrane receptor protein
VEVNGGAVFKGTVYDTQAGLPPKANIVQYGGSIKAELDLGGPKLTSTTAVRKSRMQSNFDQDGGPAKFVDAIFNEKTFTVQQEFLLVGDLGRLDYTGGLFYFYAKAGNRPLAFDSVVSPSLIGISRFSQLHTKSYAAFAQGTYHLTDTTGLTAGVRYTSDDRDISGYNLRRSTGLIIPAGVIAGVQGPLSQQKTFKKVTYRFAIDQKVNDNILLYASYSRGFKSGVFNATSYEAAPVNPETLDAAEVGIKTDLFDRTLRFNVSAFHYKYDQLQLQRVSGGQTVNINAGSAKVNGAEVEIIAQPPMPEGHLTLSANASYLHARFGTFVNMPILVPRLNLTTNTPASPFGNITVAGTTNGLTLPRAPSFTMTLNGDYSIPVGSGELGFNVNYYYNDGYFGDIDNRVQQKAYGLLNGQISYGPETEAWKITGWIRNITNKVYFNQFSNSGIGDQVSPGAPRTYGVTLGFKFGG